MKSSIGNTYSLARFKYYKASISFVLWSLVDFPCFSKAIPK